jgi:hypothetical protein
MRLTRSHPNPHRRVIELPASAEYSGLSALLRLLALECLDCILGFSMVVLFDVGPLTDQPFTDHDESDEQHNKADHSPKQRAYCEHQRHSVRLPSLRSAVIT